MRRLVALSLEGPRFVEELKKAWNEGDAVLPVDQRLSIKARRVVIKAMRPSVLISADANPVKLRGAEPVEDGDGLVMATSGTTGEPKGVVLTRSAVTASANATSRRLNVDFMMDSWWACLPLSHVGGLSVVTRAMVEGVRLDVGSFSVPAALEALRNGATLTSLVPTALSRLDPFLAGGFRRILLGGQAPPASLPPNVITTYGMTETGSGVIYDGVPLDGVEVRVVAGEIQLRCPMLLRCYRDGTDPKDSSGWFATGDGGEIAPDGRVIVYGRFADLIITGGENVWPAAVEAIVSRHPAVSEVVVVGAPDPDWGERVVAYVVLRSEHAPRPGPRELLADLRELVRSELAGYAAPREVAIVKAIPRTAIGKVRRSELSAEASATR